jgi:hypothetical protein
MKHFFLFIGVFIYMNVIAQDDTAVYKPVEIPAGFTSQLNVVYTKVGDWEGRMDLYLPGQ